MIIVALEIANEEQHRILEFVKKTATSIRKGYGAGNCTPESVAFWSLYPKDLQEGWFIIHIELDGDNLSTSEITAAVERVTEEPSGEIVVYGKTVGRWRTIR